MTDPAYRRMNEIGCSRGSPAWTTPGIGTPEAPVLGWPSCASCCVARTGQSRCRTTLPGPVSPQWFGSPPDKPRDRGQQTPKPEDRGFHVRTSTAVAPGLAGPTSLTPGPE